MQGNFLKDSLSKFEMYLYLSCFPNFSDTSLEWFLPDQRESFGHGIDDESWWIAEGVKTFKKTIVDELANTPAGVTHIVYLSGGMDSRIILGGLLENLPRSQIVAVTYGIPGSWDMEIPLRIAKKFQLQHEVFDLTNDKWDLDQLLQAARRLSQPVSVHQSYVRQKVTNCFGKNNVYWSGFMGDALSGVDMPKTPNTDKRQAIELVLRPLVTRNYEDAEFLNQLIELMIAELPWDELAASGFTLDQQLYFGIRQLWLTGPTVLFNEFSFITPFLNKRWVNFCSHIPYKWLIKQHLYRRIVAASHKGLARFPVSTSFGMSIRASSQEIFVGKIISRIRPYIERRDPYLSHPRTNYINWTESLRSKGSLQDSVHATLESLKKRGIFSVKEIDTWWQAHLTRKMDYTTLLMNLSSLELLIAAGLFMN